MLIPHFYDGVIPLSGLEKQAIADAPRNEDKLRQEFGLGRSDGGGQSLLAVLNEPSLNICLLYTSVRNERLESVGEFGSAGSAVARQRNRAQADDDPVSYTHLDVYKRQT